MFPLIFFLTITFKFFLFHALGFQVFLIFKFFFVVLFLFFCFYVLYFQCFNQTVVATHGRHGRWDVGSLHLEVTAARWC